MSIGVLALCLGGCGEDATQIPKSDAELCAEVRDARCARSAACALSTDRDRVMKDCEFYAEVELDCSRIAILGNTELCLRELAQAECPPKGASEIVPLPEACAHVFGVR